ncbi:MAG: MFS transporter [Pseudomonadota bacterium]
MRYKFSGFLTTLFCGAINDTFLKTSVLFLFVTVIPQQSSVMHHWIELAFIFPFLLFSGFAGYIANHYEQSWWIQRLAFLKLLICCLAIIAFTFNQLWFYLLLIFAMGSQSSLFGPIKYSAIPRLVNSEIIIKANAWVGAVTFLAIFLGSFFAGILFEDKFSQMYVPYIMVCIAIIGWYTSHKIPILPALTSKQPKNLLAFWKDKSFFDSMDIAKQKKPLIFIILGISWFWFLGAAYFIQLPVFTRSIMLSSESVMSLFLGAFTSGVIIGGLLCARMSCNRVEPGMVPLGALGLTIFSIDLSFVHITDAQQSFSLLAALSSSTHWHAIIDMILIGCAGGFFVTPLYAMIQERTRKQERARMLAMNNFLNAFSMVTSAITGLICFGWFELTLDQYFFGLAILNFFIAIYLFSFVPEFVLRFILWCLLHVVYRIKAKGFEKIPEKGPVILISNHVSYVDAVLIGSLCTRPTRFVIYKPIYDLKVLNWVFKLTRSIPINSKANDSATYHQAFETITNALNQGEIICIFPEGSLTYDGQIRSFRSGLLKILQEHPATIVPIGLNGLWESVFSRQRRPILKKIFSSLRRRVGINVGDPIAADDVDLDQLRQKVQQLSNNKTNY